MEEYHDRDCNTTLRLGSNQNGIKRDINSRVILDLSIGENEKERSKLGDEEIDFFKDFSRKKLRLSKDQTILLEESFKQHSTLNTAQKQTLAGKLNLKPRQVEVWFQNRRARSKLKKTEVDCQFLKKHCERLSEENCRLKKELVELRSKMKTQKPPPATPWPAQQRCSVHVVKLERCPSCDKD